MSKHIIIAVTNDLVTDQRVSRIADTLVDKGYEITLVGRLLPNSVPINREYGVKRFKLWFNKGSLFYANYNVRLFFYLLFKKFDAVLSNDLDTLLASFTISQIRNKGCIYDSHEYFTEVPELVNRIFQKKVWELIERSILPKVNYCYTVSQPIADEYSLKYGNSFEVVRNLPTKKQKQQLDKNNVLIYQGALNLGRGIELMIETIKYIENYELWVVGTGDVVNKLKELVVSMHLVDRVKFLGRIEPNKLHHITIKAKLGLSFEEDLGKNYRYALPNKLFDYIQARVPVLVSGLPEMKKVVDTYKVGEVLISRHPEKVAKQILYLLDDSDKLSEIDAYLEKASDALCWENEKHKLLTIFDNAVPF